MTNVLNTVLAIKAKQTNDAARLSSISSTITSVCRTEIAYADGLAANAKDENDKAKVEASNARENAMRALADRSAEGSWTELEISAASSMLKKAKEDQQGLSKSIKTFISEAGVVMHPNVRDDIGRIIGMCNDAWTIEGENPEKGAPKPLREAFLRKYHCILSTSRFIKDGASIPTMDHLIAEAHRVIADRKVDTAKTAKELEAIVGKLRAISSHFDLADIVAAADGLATVTKEVLDAVRGMVPGATTVVSDQPDQTIEGLLNEPTETEEVPATEEVPEVEVETVAPPAPKAAKRARGGKKSIGAALSPSTFTPDDVDALTAA
jgi:hypothetical protein